MSSSVGYPPRTTAPSKSSHHDVKLVENATAVSDSLAIMLAGTHRGS
jgi:hypothetical protein